MDDPQLHTERGDEQGWPSTGSAHTKMVSLEEFEAGSSQKVSINTLRGSKGTEEL